jgi:hypothetical protein
VHRPHSAPRGGPVALRDLTEEYANPSAAYGTRERLTSPTWTALRCPIADLFDNPGRVVVRQVVPCRRVSSDRRTQLSGGVELSKVMGTAVPDHIIRNTSFPAFSRFPPGSCSALTELSESCVAQSFPR